MMFSGKSRVFLPVVFAASLLAGCGPSATLLSEADGGDVVVVDDVVFGVVQHDLSQIIIKGLKKKFDLRDLKKISKKILFFSPGIIKIGLELTYYTIQFYFVIKNIRKFI